MGSARVVKLVTLIGDVTMTFYSNTAFSAFLLKVPLFVLIRALAIAIALQASNVMAYNPSAVAWEQEGEQWLMFSTEHFEINFLSQHQELAERAATIAETSWDDITVDFKWQPKDRIQIVLTDDFDFSNGWATPVPFNQIRVFISPPDGNSSLEYYDDWFNLLITHELTHIIQMDMAFGAPAVLRKILGRNQLTFPHALTPSLFLEGLAVYKETNKELGYGRGQSSSYDMMMREEVVSGIDDFSQVVAPLREWPLGKQYLYGYYYYQFLSDTYGPEKITEYLNLYARNIIPFFLQNWDAEKIFDKSHDELWGDFKVWLDSRFKPQIAEINQYPLVKGKLISHEGLFLDQATVSDSDYFYVRNNGEDRYSIIKRGLDSNVSVVGEVKNIIDLDASANGDLVYTRIVSRGDGRLFADIFTMAEDGDSERLTFEQRYRNVRWINAQGAHVTDQSAIAPSSDAQSRGLLAKKIENGISQLDLLSDDGEFQKTIWAGTLDDVLGEYNVSEDGRFLIANIKRAQQGWNLEVFDIESRQWKAVTNTKNLESQARFSKDGKHIIFSADYDLTFNLYQMNIESKEVERLTRVMGGAFKPLVLKNKVFYQRYGSEGYNHAVIDRAQIRGQQGLQVFNISQKTGQFNYPDLYTELTEHSAVEEYSPWSTLAPSSWLPVIAGDKYHDLIGISVAGGDALGRHLYDAGIFWDGKNNLASGSLLYMYDNKWQVTTLREHKYDKQGSGGKLNIREKDTFEVARINLINGFENNLKLSLGVNSSIESELKNRNEPLIVAGPSGELRLNRNRLNRDYKNSVVGARFDFDNTEFYSQSNSVSWGTQGMFLWETHDWLDSDFTGDVLNASFSQFLDLPGTQVVAFNAQGAYGFESPRPFELGGNTSLLAQPLFARDTWSLRGYDENVQRGNRLQVNSLEYRFPISTIERNWGLFPIGLGNISGTVFSDHGAAWSDDQNYKYLTSAGFEMNVELVVAYGAILPIKLGYAKGFDSVEGGERTYVSTGFAF